MLSNFKSFSDSTPYVCSLLLLVWLMTENIFFAYLSVGTGIVIFTSAILYVVRLFWHYGPIVFVDIELDFFKLLSYLIFILMTLVIFLYKVV